MRQPAENKRDHALNGQPTPTRATDITSIAEGTEDLDPIQLRRRAEAVLAALRRAQAETKRQLKAFNRADAMEAVAGKSAIDSAIEATRRSINRLDDAVAHSVPPTMLPDQRSPGGATA